MPRKPHKPRPSQQKAPRGEPRPLPHVLEDLFPNAFPGGFTLRDEANAIVAYAFRNGPLEDLHAGAYSPLLERDGLSRITDEEMKVLMVDACEKMEQLLRLRETDPNEYARLVRSQSFLYCKRWER